MSLTITIAMRENDKADPADAIEASGVSKCYGDVWALEPLDLVIRRGEFFGLLGHNGSGKTTTLHLFSTLVRPTAGRIRVAGHDVTREPVAVRRAIGLVFQESALDRTLTVEENLRLAGALYQLPARVVSERINQLLSLFELGDRRGMAVAKLSGGMRRAVDIARGVLHQPEILFLDEPTIGLDVLNRRAIWRFLDGLRKDHGVTIVLSTHYLEEAASCDRAAFLKAGRIIGQGQPQQLIAALGAYILELETDSASRHATLFHPQLGTPIVEGNRLLFRIKDGDFSIADLDRKLRAEVKGWHLRHPDLNDVYVWLNRGGLLPTSGEDKNHVAPHLRDH
ncbi:MAG: ABC transporter ATP-binding protein [Gammaproteobacteria bacterium]